MVLAKMNIQQAGISIERSISHLRQVSELVRQLLGVHNAGNAKPLISALIEELVAITDIDMQPLTYSRDCATHTDNGKAISMLEAAKCAGDIERTRVFLQGVYQAILDKLRMQPAVEILYAGSGPFGLLITPLLPLFVAEKIQVTFIDIHEESLQKLKKVIHAFGVADRVCAIELADATEWQPVANKTFDIILSETMKHLLQQEPQVQIFAHLQQFLKSDGVLIPEQVKISAWLSKHNHLEKSPGCSPAVCLGTIFVLNRENAAELKSGNNSSLSGSLPVPEYSAELEDLKLTTSLCVYKEHVLVENQSQLTLPIVKSQVCLEPGSFLQYRYELGSYPDFHFNYKSTLNITDIPLVESVERSRLGICHLERLWHKAQYDRLGKLDRNLRQREWGLDSMLMDQLGLAFDQCLLKLYECNVFEDFENWVLLAHKGVIDTTMVSRINQNVLRYLHD